LNRGRIVWRCTVSGTATGVGRPHGAFGAKNLRPIFVVCSSRLSLLAWQAFVAVAVCAGGFQYPSFPAVGMDPKAGFIWVYGGQASVGSPAAPSDALWRYNTASRMWMWVTGTASTSSILPVYNVLGATTATSTPGSRGALSTVLVDPKSNLWLYGGSCSVGAPSDLWMSVIVLSLWLPCVYAVCS
jgi:hypothetical protein